MKPRRDRTMRAKLIDNIGKEEAAIASVYNLSDNGDITLVAAAKNENRQAFEVLVERHARRVFFAARRMTRTREDAEDVVQQSFQKAFAHLHQFEGKSSFSTWLTRIAMNEALMLLRRSHGLREVPMDDSNANEEAATLVEVPDASPDPEDDYSQRERQRILSAAMNELTPGMRKAIQLRELDERSTEETARIMGISVGAVKARVFHGRRKLRERLKRYVGSAWTSGRDASRTIGNTRHISRDPVPCNACD
jgi:RNA polymerase sigma-70 factor (ECF subfamily)